MVANIQPNRTTGVRGSTTRLNRDGTSADITLEGSNETLQVENQKSKEPGKPDQGVISRLKDGQIIDTVTFPLPIEPPIPTPPVPPVTPPPVGPDFAKACDSVKKFCEGTSKVAKVVSFAADALALTGLVLAPVSGGTSLLTIEPLALGLKGVSNALKVVKYSCIALTGSDSDLASTLIKDIGKDAIKAIAKSGEIAGDVGKGTAVTLNRVVSATEDIINSFQKKEPTASKTNFLPQIRKWLADKTGMPFDLCDKPATTPVTEPAPTCLDFNAEITPSVLNYGQTAEVKVTYCNSDHEIDNIHVWLANGKTKDIPVSSSSGTVTFGIRNKPNSFGDCDDFGFAASGRLGLPDYLVVSGTSKGRELASMSNLVNFHPTGGLTQIVTQFNSSALCGVEFV